MLALTGATRIFLYRGAADMRKSFDGLSGLVRSELDGATLPGRESELERSEVQADLLAWPEQESVHEHPVEHPIIADIDLVIEQLGLSVASHVAQGFHRPFSE